MGQPIPAQHPSVVLRSHFKLVRTLLILAMAAVVALAAAVVILAKDDDTVDTASKATPAVQAQAPTQAGVRFDGGPEEGTRGLAAGRQLPVGIGRVRVKRTFEPGAFLEKDVCTHLEGSLAP